MARLFAVGLVAFEIVNGRGDELARLLAGTNGVDLVPDGEQRLKRHHDFVVFDEVAGDEENLLGCHVLLESKVGLTRTKRCSSYGSDDG